MAADILQAQRQHLANLLEAVQRCIYFLEGSSTTFEWPLTEGFLLPNKKAAGVFEALSAINERFAKLQDTLGAAMRHGLLLAGENAESFLAVLAAYEKFGVISSIDSWQLCRAARNLAAHDYETDYRLIAAHFNTLHELRLVLYGVAFRFVDFCADQLKVSPASADFAQEFMQITSTLRSA